MSANLLILSALHAIVAILLQPHAAQINIPLVRKRGETETIFNDTSNENKAASEDAVTRAIYTSVVLCIVSILLLIAWWYYGTKRVDRDRFFANADWSMPAGADAAVETDIAAVVGNHPRDDPLCQ